MANLIERHFLFSNLTDLHNTLDRLLRPSLLEDQNLGQAMSMWIPKIDLEEEENQYVIHADIPGVNTKDVEIILENDILTLKGKKESELKEEKENYVRIERSSGYFYRGINLPNAANAEKISAKSKNGVLEIIVPKNETKSKQKIIIKEE